MADMTGAMGDDSDNPAAESGHPAASAADKARKRYRVTSFDVAAEAGVSQSTVSRALAGDPVVSEATRQRVYEAARKLNYHVDENAARLRTGRTGTLAVVVVSRPGEDAKDFNPFHYTLLGNVCAAASAAGHETLVSFQDTEERLWGLYQEQRKADGLIVIGTAENRPAWDYFRRIAGSGAHMVCWGSPFDELDWVRSDNAEGARLATGHLLAAGYRQIVCVASETSAQRQFKERYDGYAARLAEEGLPARLLPFEEGFSRLEQGRRAGRLLLERRAAEPFDAVFVCCDEMALGVLQSLREAGVQVPAQVGIVGFDGIRAGAHASPPLTSVEPDFHAAGAMLVRRLLATINGQECAKERVPVQLLPRASSQRPA